MKGTSREPNQPLALAASSTSLKLWERLPSKQVSYLGKSERHSIKRWLSALSMLENSESRGMQKLVSLCLSCHQGCRSTSSRRSSSRRQGHWSRRLRRRTLSSLSSRTRRNQSPISSASRRTSSTLLNRWRGRTARAPRSLIHSSSTILSPQRACAGTLTVRIRWSTRPSSPGQNQRYSAKVILQ